MSEQAKEEVAPAKKTETATEAAQETACQSPPPAPMPVREQTPDPRARLLELAAQLMRSNNRRLVVEYLRLRRAVA